MGGIRGYYDPDRESYCRDIRREQTKQKEIKVKKRPQVEILELRLRCPECNYILESDVCNHCGCEIDTDEIMIDIQPDEILQ